MGHYNNFKAVLYCVAQWSSRVTLEELKEQYAFLEKYVGIDKVYLEAFRGCQASREQIEMIKKFLTEKGVEVAGGITTVTPDLNDEDKKRQRLFETFCYSNEAMRNHLKEAVEFTASEFDEFIIDDFFFTQCTCEDCRREKGDRSWEEFRLAKMQEVSKNLIIGPAKKVNPRIKITIKYPNWAESYQETGYNPQEQKEIFDMIYTGTETRATALQDQHLPRYESYSMIRLMDHVAPGRNGGGWFDPYECFSIDTYLEQMYLTAFAKAKELMHFNWISLYKNKLATPLGFQMKQLDEILDQLGEPVGLPVYLPYNAQGEDHVEDYLGMLGIPMDPTPDFPEDRSSMFLTASALKDKNIISKLKDYVAKGNQAFVTSGFMIEALKQGLGIEEMTSIRYRGRRLCGNEFQVMEEGKYVKTYVKSDKIISWPMLEHRNNASWSLINAGVGSQKASIVLLDTYGMGRLITLNIPDMYDSFSDYPQEALTYLRKLMVGEGQIYLDAPANISLFTYNNDTFGIYSYVDGQQTPQIIQVHIKGKVEKLQLISELDGGITFMIGHDIELEPLYHTKDETIFEAPVNPGDFYFLKMIH